MTHSRFLLGCSSTGAFAGELEALGLTFCATSEASNGAVSVMVEGRSRAWESDGPWSSVCA